LLRAQSASLESAYREPSARLIGGALADLRAYHRLAYLCDRIGNRLSGTESLKQAIRWAAAEMKKDGLSNVQTPLVKVPHWVRGKESLQLISPVSRSLPMLGLGTSVGTEGKPIEAEVLVVSSFEELDAKAAQAKGRIVLYDVPYKSYGETVRFRASGPSRAARHGAVASLVRSVGSASLRTPHTGGLSYTADVPKIPGAAITWEDSMMLRRLFDSGDRVVARLSMEAKMLPNADSANVIGDIPGRERPDEVVVMGGHIDSWDVGQGAHDDGSGCVTAMEAARIILESKLRPRRTIRVCLWTNEENGLAGGRAYRAMVGDSVSKHVAAIEMDGGAEKPRGFDTTLRNPKSLAMVREIGALLKGIGANEVVPGFGGADIGPLVEEGVPGFDLRTVGEHYFDWHHTEADTLDKIQPENLQACVATMAVWSYVLADMPGTLEREKPEPRRR
jgi:carboxypeptidase Q